MSPTELELIATRDHDAMARFYDRHVAMVGEFCASVCPDERVDEAVAAVFVNLLGRVSEAPPDAQPEELLRKAAREVAASRMDVEAGAFERRGDPVCRAMPELLAARTNGELRGQSGPIADHLSSCPTCQATAARLGQAEVLFPVGSAGGVTELRAEWLELAVDANKAADGAPGSGASAADPSSSPSQPGLAHAPPAVPIRGWEPPEDPQNRAPARRGGLVDAVRRFAGTPGTEPPARRPSDEGSH